MKQTKTQKVLKYMAKHPKAKGSKIFGPQARKQTAAN